jgi:CheY-like chemotaxis protein
MTIWLDDDSLFLDMVRLSFQKHSEQHKFFDDPKHCLDFLTAYSHKKLQTQKKFIYSDSSSEQHGSFKYTPANFDITKIAEIYRNAERFQEISVLIIDHNMPLMKGLDICYKLKHLPLKKILLTNAAQKEEVISAFNDGIIDLFLCKEEPNLFAEIQKQIDKLTKLYFCEQTSHLLSYLETDHLLPLSDEQFALFFEEIKTKKQIKEFYLIDKNGSLLLIDNHDKKHFLVIHNERSLNEFCQLYSDTSALKDLIQATMRKEKIPFFGLGKETGQKDLKHWNKYFYKPDFIKTSRDTYYWTLV